MESIADTVFRAFERIDRIRSVSEQLDALRGLDREVMLRVLGFGMAQPSRGGHWELLDKTLSKG